MKKLIALFIFTFILLSGIIGCTGDGTSPTGNASPTASTRSTTAAASPSTAAKSSTSGLSGVIQNYYKAIEKHEYEKAYAYVADGAKTADGQKLTLALLTQMAKSTERTEGTIQSLDTATYPPQVIMTIIRQKLGPYHTHIEVKQEEGIWKITSIDRI